MRGLCLTPHHVLFDRPDCVAASWTTPLAAWRTRAHTAGRKRADSAAGGQADRRAGSSSSSNTVCICILTGIDVVGQAQPPASDKRRRTFEGELLQALEAGRGGTLASLIVPNGGSDLAPKICLWGSSLIWAWRVAFPFPSFNSAPSPSPLPPTSLPTLSLLVASTTLPPLPAPISAPPPATCVHRRLGPHAIPQPFSPSPLLAPCLLLAVEARRAH